MSRSRAKRRQHPPQQILREQQQRPQPQRPVVDGALALAEGMPKRSSLNALNAQQLGASASQQWQNWPLNAAGKPIPQLPDEPHQSPDTDLYGASGTAIFSGIITTDEYNPDLLSPIDRSQVYDQMRRNHAPVSAMLRLLSLPILRATAKIEAGQDGDDEVASFVDTCLFHDMQYDTTEGATYRQTWDEILRHILLMYAFGFVGFELGYRVDDGWTKWSKWTPLLPRTIWRWWVGADNELAGIQQWTFRNWSYEFVNIPAWKALIFTLNQEGANYEGISILRAAYKHWMYVQGFEKIDAIALERSAVVPPVIAVPENYTANDIAAAQTITQNIRANEYLGVVIPNTWGFEYPRNQAKYAAQTQPAIQYGNAMILTAALADWVALGQGPGATGTYALADIKVKMFQEALQGDVCLIEQRVNTAIRRLVDYNFEDVEVYPTLKFGKIALSDVAGMAQSIQQLVQAQVVHPTPELEEAILDGLGLPKGQGVASEITSTNPTSPTTPPQPQNPQTAGQTDESQPTQPNAGAQMQAGGGEGAQLAEAHGGTAGLSEGQLLTETLAAIRGVDVVERGMVFYNPNHDPHSGHFAPGGAGGAAEGESGGAGGRGSRSGGGAKASRGGGGAKQSAQDRQAANSARPGQPRGSGKAARGKTADAVVAAGGKGGAPGTRAAKATQPAAEGMHERAARLQREQGLRAETRPENFDSTTGRRVGIGEVHAGHTVGVVEREISITNAISPHMIALAYGEHQLGAALSRYSAARLNQAARIEGVTPGRTRAETVSRLTSKVTEGRYSADFGQAAEGAKGGAKAGKGSTPATAPARTGARARTSSSSGKAEEGAATAAGKQPAETLHQKAERMRAQDRAEGINRPEEAQPSEHPQAIRSPSEQHYDPFMSQGDVVRGYLNMYGDHQLGALLTRGHVTVEHLREMARSVGETGRLPRDRGALISLITSRATDGRYSANFGETGTAKTSKPRTRKPKA